MKNVHDGSSNVLEVEPGNDTSFERIRNLSLSFSDIGEIGRVAIAFRNGDRDETVFQSWSLLARDDPEILQLNQRLQDMAQRSAQRFPKKSSMQTLAEMKDDSPSNLVRVVAPGQ